MIAALTGILALCGAPLFAVFAAAALLLYAHADLDRSLIAAELGRLATMPLLQTLPMFALAGYVLAHSNASRRLVRLSRAAFGWLPGGLAIVALLACTLLTAFTGASGITIVALGGLLMPALLADGYGERFTLGLVTVGGSLGLLFAPSLPLILYGVIAGQISPEVTVDRLFLAGVLPGLMITLLMAAYGMLEGLRFRVARTPFSPRELGAALWAAKWEVPLPFVVLGGIYTGKLVISEAAVITAAYALAVEALIYREIPWRRLSGVIRESMVLVGGILVILGMAMAITNYLVDQEVPMLIFDAVQRAIRSRVSFLVALNLFLLAVGCVMDIFTAIVVIVPLVIPVALEYGVNPTHLGIIFLANLGIGYCTPPVGVNLFIAGIRFGRPIISIYRATLVFLLLLLAALAVITYVPGLSLWLAE
ncbi:MAG: TRAP transporter large permease subunit [Lentisphaerae bacterium]|nr:TRAP transporter large permease subunit [Lentisphaerota bacterium]